MQMKRYPAVFFILAALVFCGCAHPQKYRGAIFQYSTIGAFTGGLYDGELTSQELKKRGDFGIGTFNGVDGELILFKGACYQAKEDGKVSAARNNAKIPFAVAKHFKPSAKIALSGQLSYKQLTQYLDILMPERNLFFAVKIEGNFSFVETRSIAKQNKPYQPFADVAKAQRVSKFTNIKGFLVGFRFPDYMKELEPTGYHFHFISRNRKSGGHLVDCNILSGAIEINRSRSFSLLLPDNKEFLNAALSKDSRQEMLEALE